MAMMFGRFEILSELSKSEHAAIFKATDTETNQTVALKTVHLESLGDHAPAFVEKLLAEGEATRNLSTQNIALLYGAGEIDNQFCAAMEYVQGNSVRTMVARKEGFSIWDLLDITRQFCAGLEHASELGVVHYSLEPAKVMVQWDGLVKILGYGISSMSLIEAGGGAGLGPLLPYCSPEQVRGDDIDLRSNLFTWGTILYEMVADRRAFDAAEPDVLTQQILSDMPPKPALLNPKIHPGVSALIMKALAKHPEERYQFARDLVNALESCKENGKKSSAATRKSAPARTAVAPVAPAAREAAASKFIAAAPRTVVNKAAADPRPAPPPRPAAPPTFEPAPSMAEPSISEASIPEASVYAPPRVEPRAFTDSATFAPETKAASAAAGVGAGATSTRAFGVDASQFMDDPVETSPLSRPTPVLSAATVEPPPVEKPVFVDPIMGDAPAETEPRKSFSDLDELPPMKPVVFEAPAPPLEEEAPERLEPTAMQVLRGKKEEKPKIQPREVAEKALYEIKTVPPKLIIFSILGAVVLILIVAVAVYFHVRSEDDESTAAPRPMKETSQPQPAAPAVSEAPVAAPAAEPEPEVTVRQIDKRAASKKRAPAPAPVAIIPGQAQVDSNPQGAQIQIDGKSDPSWVTPFNLTGLAPGQHTISVSKSGYTSDTRSIDVPAGGKSFVSLHLAPINALVVVNSNPAGAEVILDGKNTGRTTPAQFAVEKGSHTVVLRKQGYLDETTTADLAPGQNLQFGPALRPLGNVDDIKTVGKFKKLFGGGGDTVAGMGTVGIRTAQGRADLHQSPPHRQ